MVAFQFLIVIFAVAVVTLVDASVTANFYVFIVGTTDKALLAYAPKK